MNIPKKLAVIQDLSGIGRCSLSVAIPIISACKVQAYPLPTAIFSNHMGFQQHVKVDISQHISSILEQWNQLPVSVDALYCGYLGSHSLIDTISTYIQSFSTRPQLFVDPVMGDHGHMYHGLDTSYVDKLRFLITDSDVITPNLTEACLLADVAYPSTDTISESFLASLAAKLCVYHIKTIIITGIPSTLNKQKYVGNYIYDTTTKQSYLSQVLLESHFRPGTGDMFASIVFSYLLRGFSVSDSVYSAQEFIRICTKTSDEAFVPIQEGAVFENDLGLLNTSYPLKYQNHQM